MRADPRVLAANSHYRRFGAPDKLPIPPAHLIFLVAGSSDIEWFLKGGSLAAESVVGLLQNNGVDINAMDVILDFGCGSGRVLRYWESLRETRVCGSDYNPLLVDWCKRNLLFADVR